MPLSIFLKITLILCPLYIPLIVQKTAGIPSIVLLLQPLISWAFCNMWIAEGNKLIPLTCSFFGRYFFPFLSK